MSSENIEFSITNNLEYSESDFHEINKKLSTKANTDIKKLNKKCFLLDSEIPLEIKYQISNVLSLLQESIEKLKISLILPKILKNPKVLQQYLRNTEYENCLKLVQDYRHKQNLESEQEPNRIDYHVIKLIDFFQENYKILEVLPNWIDDIDNTEKCLLKAFDDVCQVARERFYRSAIADLAKEKRLHEVFLANEEVKTSIEGSIHRIQQKKLHHRWKFAAKGGVLKQLEDEIAFHQYDNNTFVKKEICKINREMQQINYNSKIKQQELQEDVEKSRLNYEKKLKEDLIQERNIRDERNKLQLQLQALITKYDQTIYDKYKENVFLQEEYEKQKQEFDDFLIVYKEEEVIYEELVSKKEREYQSLHEAKILLFTNTRAAKRIQRWWRKYLRAQKEMKKKMAKKAEKAKGKAKAIGGNKEKPTGKAESKEAKNKPNNKGKKN